MLCEKNYYGKPTATTGSQHFIKLWFCGTKHFNNVRGLKKACYSDRKKLLWEQNSNNNKKKVFIIFVTWELKGFSDNNPWKYEWDKDIKTMKWDSSCYPWIKLFVLHLCCDS